MFPLRLTFAQSVVTSEQTDKADKMGQVWGYVYSNLMEQICVHTLSNDMYMIFMVQSTNISILWNNDIYDIYGTNISLKQWYVYDIYGTNMSILKTMICVWYLWNKYVRTWNNYMGLSLLNLNVKEQVYSYRNRTSLVCTVSGSDKTSLHQCLLMM